VEPSVSLSSKERQVLEASLETEERPQPPILPGPGKRKAPWHGKELDLIWPIQGKINSLMAAREQIP